MEVLYIYSNIYQWKCYTFCGLVAMGLVVNLIIYVIKMINYVNFPCVSTCLVLA